MRRDPEPAPGDRAPSAEVVFRAIERATFERVFSTYLKVRLVLAPALMVLVMGVALVDPSPWRLWVIGTVFIGSIAAFWYELWRARHRGVGEWSLPVNMALIALLQLVIIGITGALESPLMPIVFAFATLAAVAIGRRAGLWLVIGVQAVGVVGFAIGQVMGTLPAVNLVVFGGGHRAGHNDALLYTFAGFSLLVLVLVAVLASGLRDVFTGMVREALAVREDALHTHIAQTRELQALSGEIAHELKNPLSSIKGLAALVARDLPQGKAAQRLGVLRDEVERMQGILDEFLHFSRPLLPLALEPVDLTELCQGISRLYEAVSRQKDVHIEVMEEPVVVLCDPRKIKQVLINLVDNGLAASPSGATLRLSCQATATGARITVDDEGPGLSEQVRDRAFEPGVTDKPSGSGVGLTVARAIARQHGGDLRLEAGPTGCRAVLDLPREPT